MITHSITHSYSPLSLPPAIFPSFLSVLPGTTSQMNYLHSNPCVRVLPRGFQFKSLALSLETLQYSFRIPFPPCCNIYFNKVSPTQGICSLYSLEMSQVLQWLPWSHEWCSDPGNSILSHLEWKNPFHHLILECCLLCHVPLLQWHYSWEYRGHMLRSVAKATAELIPAYQAHSHLLCLCRLSPFKFFFS